MNCLVHRETDPEPFPLPFGGAFNWVARGIGGVARAIAGRRMLRELARADDRMLRDIGLNRSDLRDAAAEPIFRDPTAVLAGRVDETGARRRAARIHRSPIDEMAERAQRLKSKHPVPYY